METIGDRIKKLAIAKSGNLNAFATGVMGHETNSTIAGAIRSNNPKYETLQEIISKTKVSAAWLMTGEGEMFSEAPTAPPADSISAKEVAVLVDQTVTRVTDTHKQSLYLIERLIGTHEGIMRQHKLIA